MYSHGVRRFINRQMATPCAQTSWGWQSRSFLVVLTPHQKMKHHPKNKASEIYEEKEPNKKDPNDINARKLTHMPGEISSMWLWLFLWFLLLFTSHNSANRGSSKMLKKSLVSYKVQMGTFVNWTCWKEQRKGNTVEHYWSPIIKEGIECDVDVMGFEGQQLFASPFLQP